MLRKQLKKLSKMLPEPVYNGAKNAWEKINRYNRYVEKQRLGWLLRTSVPQAIKKYDYENAILCGLTEDDRCLLSKYYSLDTSGDYYRLNAEQGDEVSNKISAIIKKTGYTHSDDQIAIYWNSEYSENRRILVEKAIQCLNTYDSHEPVSVLEYGAHVGVNLKRVNDTVQKERNIKYYAVEPNKEAFSEMMNKLKFVNGLNAEDTGFIDAKNFPGCKISVSLVNAVFYSMTYERVYSVCKKLAAISDFIIIGDEIANCNGNKSKLFDLTDFNNVPYVSLCHPYKVLLSFLGFDIIEVIKIKKPIRALTGIIVAKKRKN